MSRRAIAILAVATLAAACAAPAPSPSSGAPSRLPSASIVLPDPGQPFDATAILEAMRDSRRPGGVPDQLEIESIAAAVADAIWTFDGEPWTPIVAGGSCGPQACTLEIAGTPTDALGEDLWVFAVTPSSGDVELVTADLRGMPVDALASADDVLRQLQSLPPGNAALASGRWLPPPDAGVFVLNYRADGEEGTCGIDYTVDVEARLILDEVIVGC